MQKKWNQYSEEIYIPIFITIFMTQLSTNRKISKKDGAYKYIYYYIFKTVASCSSKNMDEPGGLCTKWDKLVIAWLDMVQFNANLFRGIWNGYTYIKY